MILELNEVLIDGEQRTLSMIAESGRLTCLTGGDAERLTRWLWTIMGFTALSHGFVSVDSEPITERSASLFRQLMSFAPHRLERVGQVTPYEPPSVQDVFNLKANREQPISNGILGEEIKRIGVDSVDQSVQLLAVAVLLDKPILLVDNPPVEVAHYLSMQAAKGRIVLVTSNETAILNASDQVIEI